MILFDTNLGHPLNRLSEPIQIQLLANTLMQFREFPLCNRYGYDEERLRFYDGVLGGLIRTRDAVFECETYESLEGFAEFSAQWEYKGDLYRVIAKNCVRAEGSGEPCLAMPTIKWHGMVASWSKSYDFTENFNKIRTNEKYSFICANTKDSVGIDANRLSRYLGCFNPCVEGEQEAIFPMKEVYVTDIFENITASEFKKLMDERRSWG